MYINNDNDIDYTANIKNALQCFAMRTIPLCTLCWQFFSIVMSQKNEPLFNYYVSGMFRENKCFSKFLRAS